MNLPLDNSFTYNATGAGVTFYSVDTGVRSTHTDFGGRVSGGFTSIFDGLGTEDCHGHGTHTTSTAAGITYGIAKAMSIVPVRVLDCGGTGFTSGVIAGVDWIRNNATFPAVANMSLGGGFSPSLDAAVANAVGAGITFSVSAGNSNGNACFQSPAREPSALTVGSTTISDQRSGFSNFGTCLDLFAPGSSITAAWATSDNATNTISGTSMAAPHVAGVAGQYLELNPGATPAQVATAIVSNATSGVVGNAGSGSPNLLLYSGFITGGPPPPNQPPVAAFTFTCNGLTCDFDGTSSTDDVGVTSYSWTDSGANVIGSTATFSHAFAAAGSEDITLTVTDGGGLSDSDTQTVTVTDPPPPPPGNQPPVADYTWSCDAARTCTFDGTTSTDDVGVVSWEWLINGVLRATGSVAAHSFGSNQTFPLTLRVTDGGGLTDEQVQTIDVAPGSGGGPPPPPPPNQPPVADFTFACTDLTCDFDGSSSTDDQGVVTWIWTDESLNVIGLTEAFSYTFPAAGSENITLTVGDAGGLADFITKTVTVTDPPPPPPNQPPVASFTFTCTDLTCDFDGTGSSDDVGIVSYSWTDSGGGVIGTTATFTHTFASAGSEDITLTVTDGGGLSDSDTQTVTVTDPPPPPGNQPPVASFTSSCDAARLCTFDGTSSTDDVGVVNYEWLLNGVVRATGAGGHQAVLRSHHVAAHLEG